MRVWGFDVFVELGVNVVVFCNFRFFTLKLLLGQLDWSFSITNFLAYALAICTIEG